MFIHIGVSDFNVTTKLLAFPGGLGIQTQCGEAAIANDLSLEVDEIFYLQLSSGDPDVILDIDIITVIIVNDDSKY